MMSRMIIDTPDSAFRLCGRTQGGRVLELQVQPPGSNAAPVAIWSRRFTDDAGCDALLTAVSEREIDIVFLGRLTMIFGGRALDEIADALVAAAAARREKERETEARRARDHLTVNLYAREGKHGRHLLELQRRSSSDADWSVRYDRAVERDRLCDWLRWQKDRFLQFLDHAAEHGDESLARMLINEMFVTERRVKKEGRGAGGMRPLRMWRGD
jgi:hypothetical protein